MVEEFFLKIFLLGIFSRKGKCQEHSLLVGCRGKIVWCYTGVKSYNSKWKKAKEQKGDFPDLFSTSFFKKFDHLIITVTCFSCWHTQWSKNTHV